MEYDKPKTAMNTRLGVLMSMQIKR